MIELRRPPGGFARVGHRGASALAAENTIRAFALAVELGCDTVELDVLQMRDGTLVVAHDPRHVGQDTPTLDDVLRYFADELTDTVLQVDLKRAGIERKVVDALRRRGLRERSWVSSFEARSLRRLAVLDPELPRSYTMPGDRLGLAGRRRALPLVRAAVAAQRAALPARVATLLKRARASALTLHVAVVSERAIERAHELGAAVYVWTVDDAGDAKALLAAGADGIITNDPRIFSTLTT